MKVILFDFDGVIANSQNAVLNAYNEIAKLKKIRPISKDEFLSMSTREIIHHFKIKWFQIWYYVRLVRKTLLANIHNIYAENEFELFSQKVFKHNIKFIILSSNSEKLIRAFLNKKSNIGSDFSDIVGSVSIFKKHRKINAVKKKI